MKALIAFGLVFAAIGYPLSVLALGAFVGVLWSGFEVHHATGSAALAGITIFAGFGVMQAAIFYVLSNKRLSGWLSRHKETFHAAHIWGLVTPFVLAYTITVMGYKDIIDQSDWPEAAAAYATGFLVGLLYYWIAAMRKARKADSTVPVIQT